jgi:hypothetical protein
VAKIVFDEEWMKKNKRSGKILDEKRRKEKRG